MIINPKSKKKVFVNKLSGTKKFIINEKKDKIINPKINCKDKEPILFPF